MDADLQHPPALFPKLIEGIEEGHDCCAAYRTTRTGEKKIRSFFSQSFYKLNNKLTNTKMPYGAVDYRIMSRQMVNSLVELPEKNAFPRACSAGSVSTLNGFLTKMLSAPSEQPNGSFPVLLNMRWTQSSHFRCPSAHALRHRCNNQFPCTFIRILSSYKDTGVRKRFTGLCLHHHNTALPRWDYRA